VFEALLPTVIEQKVTGHEARRSYLDLVRRYGDAAPGLAAFSCRPRPRHWPASPTTSFTHWGSSGGGRLGC
jgi:3-methyladenine DNA glycosylase/8-oxoguanine DNA glycosylase